MLKHVSLLKQQRALYDLPRGRERFNAYIALMTDGEGDLELPLSGMNPMAGDHAPKLLDAYLALEVDALADAAVTALAQRSLIADTFASTEFRTAFVLADDQKGQWTHRVAYEFEQIHAQESLFRRGWITAFLWTSQAAVVESAISALKTGVLRGVWRRKHGHGKTLEQLLDQEGWVAKQLDRKPSLSADDLAYTAEVLQPLLHRQDEPTLIAALLGDNAALKLGHPPLGLSPLAGMNWALARALKQATC